MVDSTHLPVAIYYEQPNWFKPLFAELERRGTPYVKLHAAEHSFSPGDHPEQQYSLVFNRMSPSAWNRGHGDTIFYTLGFLHHLEQRGVRVINGSKAFGYELSKAAQLSLLEELGLGYPKARSIHRPEQAVPVSEGLRWPVVVKPNIGGSGAGVTRFNTPEELAITAERNELAFGLDSTALVQEFIPAAPDDHGASHIVRVEVLNGKFIYAIKVHITGETFDLCPADICRTPTGAELAASPASCVLDAAKSGLSIEAYTPPAEVIADVERILQHAGIEVGGVEYIVDARDEQRLYYDINALSNFVSDGPGLLGFNPFVKLVDWLEAEAAATTRQHEPAMAVHGLG